ncbi:MAG: hypothetical protein QMD09_00140 [Desulfatibacillaceae bacterium]|nr:hypothetical protein [Desulfatibacillaceae bacterium]
MQQNGILSFNPVFVGDKNLLCAGRRPGPDDLSAMKKAWAVILGQGCPQELYQMARAASPRVFPNYDSRFDFPGKTGQAGLFLKYNAPFPKSLVFKRAADCRKGLDKDVGNLPFALPFVFKYDWGGEGQTVFLLHSIDELKERLEEAERFEAAGQSGFLLQEFVPCNNHSLRVVVAHDELVAYWRKGPPGKPIMGGLCQGAILDKESDPHLMEAGKEMVADFCGKTLINLAGFDLLFDERQKGPAPLFLEINWFFGRRGLGGSDAYYKLLNRAIDRWLKDLKN